MEADREALDCGSNVVLVRLALVTIGSLTPLTRFAFAIVGFDLVATPLDRAEGGFVFTELDCFDIPLLCACCGTAADWTVAFGVTIVGGVAMSSGRSPSRIITVGSWAPEPDVEKPNIPLMVWR